MGYEFNDPGLLELALTHRSWIAENPGFESNERLEFLGDSVLGLAITNHIFATYPDFPEGKLAKLRASVVSSSSLAEAADALDLGPALRLGKGERSSGGGNKPSILADATEAIFGAIYLDGGFDACETIILRLLMDHIAKEAQGPGIDDFKTRLQELVAQNFDGLPEYRHAEDGPDHDKRFTASVWVVGSEYGHGGGKSKKEAEQAAAAMAWDLLSAKLETENPGLTS